MTEYIYAYHFFACRNMIPAVLSLFKPIDFRVDFFGMIYEGRPGNMLDNHILIFCAQENFILFFLSDLAYSLENKYVVFFDIGANVGQHSLFNQGL